MKRFLLVLFIVFSLGASAQIPNLKWVKNIPFIINSMVSDENENVYAIGTFEDTITVDNTHIFSSGDGTDVIMAKYDSTGNLIWYKQVGGLNSDFATEIKLDNDDNLYLLTCFNYNTIIEGDTIPTQENSHRPLLVKYSKDGDFLWWKIPVYTEYACFHPQNLRIDNENNILLTGNSFYGTNVIFPDTIMPVNSDSYFYIAKYNSDGEFQWASRYNNEVAQISLDQANNILFVNYNDTSGISLNKLLPNGEQQWIRIINMSFAIHAYDNYLGSYISKFAIDRFNNIYLAGGYSNTITVTSESFISRGYQDIILIKFDTIGNPVWAKSFGGGGSDAPQSLLITDDKIMMTGSFYGKIYFDHDSIDAPYPPLFQHGFIVQYDLNGQNEIIKKLVGRKHSGVRSDLLTTSNSLYLGGRISDTTYIGDEIWIQNNVITGPYFLLRFYDDPIPPQPIVDDFEIYPNPTRGTVNFNFNPSYSEVTLQIYDLRGALVKTYTLSNTYNSLDLGFLSHGLYLARLISAAKVQCAKFEKL